MQMTEQQATAIANLINTLDLPGKAQLYVTDQGAWCTYYMFIRDDGRPDWDIISSVLEFYRWLGYRGKAGLITEEDE